MPVQPADVANSYWRFADPDDRTFVLTVPNLKEWVPASASPPWLYLPKYFAAEVDRPPLPPCTLHFVTEADSEVVCHSLEVTRRPGIPGSREVTLAGIRNIRIAELKRHAIRLAVAEARETDSGWVVHHKAAGDQIDVTALMEELAEKAHKPRRGVKLPDTHLREVAKVYRKALKAGDPPIQAVMDHFHTVRPNASRWVVIARDRKLLGKAEAERRAGEKKPKPTKGGTSRGK
jgi:hypothetical protein